MEPGSMSTEIQQTIEPAKEPVKRTGQTIGQGTIQRTDQKMDQTTGQRTGQRIGQKKGTTGSLGPMDVGGECEWLPNHVDFEKRNRRSGQYDHGVNDLGPNHSQSWDQ